MDKIVFPPEKLQKYQGLMHALEYLDKVIACVEREVADYERRLSQLTGANITLG